MAGTTISSTMGGVRVSQASWNPYLITRTGRVVASGTVTTAFYVNYGIAATLTNLGLVSAVAAGDYGVKLRSGGTITNGSTTNSTARIVGGSYGIGIGVHGGPSTVNNFGTIMQSPGGTINGAGISIAGSGTITNGGTASFAAAISGYSDGVNIVGPGSSLVNFGRITATGTAVTANASSFGAYVGNGSVTNGSATDITARIVGGGGGVLINHGTANTVTNFGTIAATTMIGRGLQITLGGTVTNGTAADTSALIQGAGRDGVWLSKGKVVNFGTIQDVGTGSGVAGVQSNGVQMLGSGSVNNGTGASNRALISGYHDGVDIGGTGTLVNFGTVQSVGNTDTIGRTGVGVYFGAGGTITNGNANNPTASILANATAVDIEQGAGTVSNFGTIYGDGLAGKGIALNLGGVITNGSTADTTAYIGASFRNAVYIGGDVGTINNFGSIVSNGRHGVSMGVGGTINNGSAADTVALISGERNGIYARGATPTAVNNYGTIVAMTRTALNIYLGGTVSNGSATDTGAYISGVTNGLYLGGPSMVTNFGTITTAANSAVNELGGGTLVNGSTAVTSAMLSSGSGTDINTGPTAPATISNFGTILAEAGTGINMQGGGNLTNGATSDLVALISAPTSNAVFLSGASTTVANYGTITGFTGVFFSGAVTGTVTNAGTITGTGGTAISFGSGVNNLLVVKPGAVFNGTVAGGNTTAIELSGTAAGAIGGIGSTFTGITKVTIDSGANWSFLAPSTIANLLVTGTGSVAGALLTVSGAIDPLSTGTMVIGSAGTLDVAADASSGGTINFNNTSSTLVVEHAAQFGTGIGGTFAGPALTNFGTLSAIDFKDVTSSVTTNYNPSTGVMALMSGATALAEMHFDLATLGTGSFHIGSDISGHAVLTHS